jgi:hypothetical protein
MWGLLSHDREFHKSPVLPTNDAHVTGIPIDHPDASIRPAKLDAIDTPADGEAPTYDAVTGRFKWNPVGGAAICKVAHDYPERDITETTETAIHDVFLIRKTSVGTDFTTLIVQAEGYSATGLTTYLKIYEGATLLITLSWTETAAAVKTGTADISGWADGKHQLTGKVYISGAGKGRLNMIEYWVKK